MIRVIREIIYIYDNADHYVSDRQRWTTALTIRVKGLTMTSVVVDERVIDDPPQSD